jgi:hypothetical protein
LLFNAATAASLPLPISDVGISSSFKAAMVGGGLAGGLRLLGGGGGVLYVTSTLVLVSFTEEPYGDC